MFARSLFMLVLFVFHIESKLRHHHGERDHHGTPALVHHWQTSSWLPAWLDGEEADSSYFH
jgi:hypothetical protein